eukprot:2311353-Ditylum_brightwellii.AAC.1
MTKQQQGPTVQLPFDLDIILDDRRNSSTGLHAVVMLGASNESNKNHNNVSLIDNARDDTIPPYNTNNNTYLLFPSKDSIPLSSVSTTITKLVVLDCKWTKSSLLQHPNLQHYNIPHVHLSNPPDKSYFWRWHKEGKGMLSTIEAIYYASLDVLDGKKKQQEEQKRKGNKETKAFANVSNNNMYGNGNDDNRNPQNIHKSKTNDEEKVREESNDLIHLLYLFALKRSIMNEAAKKENRALPFTEEGKELQRVIRHYNATEKQRRKEKGRLLKEKARAKKLEEKQKKEEH